jgi:hypothetical protein
MTKNCIKKIFMLAKLAVARAEENPISFSNLMLETIYIYLDWKVKIGVSSA